MKPVNRSLCYKSGKKLEKPMISTHTSFVARILRSCNGVDARFNATGFTELSTRITLRLKATCSYVKVNF